MNSRVECNQGSCDHVVQVEIAIKSLEALNQFEFDFSSARVPIQLN